MSRSQCQTCVYRDQIVSEGDILFCPVAERLTPGDPCPSFEDEDEDEDEGGKTWSN